VALYEATFAAVCEAAFRGRQPLDIRVSADRLARLEADREFQEALLEGTTQTKNVKTRLSRSREILTSP
jgi:hypothetical protein